MALTSAFIDRHRTEKLAETAYITKAIGDYFGTATGARGELLRSVPVNEC